MSVRLSLRRAIGESWRAGRQNYSLFLGLYLALTLLGVGINSIDRLPVVGPALELLLQTIIGVIGGILITSAALRAFDSATVSFASVWSKLNWRVFGWMLLANILFAAGVMIGSLLLFVPGIIFAVSAGLFQMVLINEDATALQALRRSFLLTRGHRGEIFSAWFALSVPLIIVATSIYVFALSSSSGIESPTYQLAVDLVFIPFSLILTLVSTHFYRELHHAKTMQAAR